MSNEELPKGQSELLAFANNVNDKFDGREVEWHLTEAQVNQLGTDVAAAHNALAKLSDPMTRSPGNVFLKDVAFNQMTTTLRSLIQAVKNNPLVPESLLAQIGVTRRGSNPPTPAPVPTEAPLVSAMAVSPTAIKVIVRSPSDPDRRGKPAGIRQVAVATSVSETAPTSSTQWNQAVLSGKTTVEVPMGSLVEPATVWVTAWWINSRNEIGPFATPQRVRLAGTGAALPNAERSVDETPMKIAA
ncbi:MAG: hypothetical protein AAGI46_15185 [Planctomycetota bacterium]